MRARALFAAAVGALLLVVASPAVAKVGIAGARISGPGLGEGGLHITPPATEGMWDAGLDWADGLDDTRADSIGALGLTAAELGPRYVITYRLDAGTRAAEIVRQELYPYVTDGPVTYTPAGQRIAEGLPWEGAISTGWYQSPLKFFHYLVNQGLPESNAVMVADGESALDTVPSAGSTHWGWIAVVGLLALSVASPLRRRVFAMARAHH